MPGSLAKIFRNQEEVSEPNVAELFGNIPNWISGSYVRVGPGKFDIGDITMNHFIDGYAMLSKFDIRDGRVTFDKKYLQSDAYKKASQAKRPILPEFATKGNLESKNFFSRVISAFNSCDITDNDAINLYTIEGDIYAASESCHIHNISAENLSTTGEKIDYFKLFGTHMSTAHPIRDRNGDLYNIGTSFTTGCKYQVLKIPSVPSGCVKDAIKKSQVIATIYPSWSTCFSYYHSFAMSENYIIMVEQPLLMNVVKIADAKMNGKGIKDIMQWTPTEKNRFHIVNKKTGEVLKTKYYADKPFFYFHFVNSYEEGDQLVIDISAYASAEVMDKMLISRLRSGNIGDKDPARVTRFVIPILKSMKDVAKGENLVTLPYTNAAARRDNDSIILSPEGLGEPGFEGPCINPLKTFSPHRYIFGTGSCLPGYYENSVCKLDTKTGEVKLWRDGEFYYPGEPLFIPHPDGKAEDDGIIISAISDSREGPKDFLVFINGQTMKELGRAVVSTQVPQALHGIFIPRKG